ncbi:hypothetical protein HGRIS_010428 [Hohenbuehelia grisea]|uniref:NACHT domain-containing protein n=1 Tax=Hohenbuehelia grisea TaxID=104357 RepID=A0ABR3IZ26_9AGAR
MITMRTKKPQVVQDVMSGLKLTLKTLDNVSESIPVPGARVCFAVAVKIWESNDKAHENTEDLLELCKYLDGFRNALEFKGSSVRSELAQRIELSFAEFQKREEEIARVKKRNWVRRMLYADEDAAFIKKMFRKIKTISEWFQLEAVKNIELSVRKQEQAFIASKLPIAKDASWNCTDCDECIEGTRLTVLKELREWMIDASSPQILWLTGLAGKGKSTIAKTLARHAHDNNILGASFFCSRNHAARSDSVYIIPTFAEQLSARFPESSTEFYEAIENNPGVGYRSRSEQLKCLVMNPFRSAISTCETPILLLIDALDEVDKDPSQPSSLLLALLSAITQLPNLKVCMSSRPEYPIRSELQPLAAEGRVRILDLGDLQPTEVDEDIQQYISSYLQYTLRFPRSSVDACAQDIARLVKRSAQLFIFASTAIKTLRRNYDLHEQLTDIIAYDGIDRLYESILTSALANLSPTERAKRARLLGILVLLRQPLPPAALAQLSGFSTTHVRILLDPFHSVVAVPDPSDGNDDGVVRIIHQSFRDFLVERCSIADMRVVSTASEKEISLQLFRVMEDLAQVELDEDNLLSDPTKDPFAENILCRYACYNWADHLACVTAPLIGADDVETAFGHFIRQHCWKWRAYFLSRCDFRIAADIWAKAKGWYNAPEPYINFRLEQFMGLTHMERGDKFARLDDIEVAIQSFQSALTHSSVVSENDRAMVIRSLADALYYDDFFKYGHVNLGRRTALLEGALKLDITPQTRAKLLNSLGLAFYGKYNRVSRDQADLNESISLRRQALALRPNTPTTLYYLATALLHRYDQHPSSLADLDEADELTRKAVALTSIDNYRDMGLPAYRLRVTLLNTKFARTREPELLREAVALAREAFSRALPAYRVLGWAGCTLIKTLQHMLTLPQTTQECIAILDEIVETANRTVRLQQMQDKMRKDLRRWGRQALNEKNTLLAEVEQPGGS